MKLSFVTVYVSPEANKQLSEAHEFAAWYNPQHVSEDLVFNVVRLRCDGGSLPRDSTSELDDTRRLPYLQDVLEAAASLPSEWIGYINADIILTQYFADAFVKATEARDMLLLRVSDIPQATPALLKDRRRWRPRPGAASVDGIFVRAGSGIQIPDFVLGEPFWDNGVILMAQRMGDRATTLNPKCALHVVHPMGSPWEVGDRRGEWAEWTGLNPGGDHNRRLYFELLGDVSTGE